MTSAELHTDLPTQVIRPSRGLPIPDLRELWHYRELLYFLALRDLKVRYKQTLLGIAWAVIQPVMYMIVFTLFFGHIGHFYTEGQPYALLALAGPVIWLYFANAVQLSSNSLVGNASLVTKVYFPRLLAPVAPVAGGLVDLLLASGVLVAVMAGYGEHPAPERIWIAIPFVLLAMGTAVGVGSLLAALNVRYRDVRYVVPFLLQLWLFASPVAYSPALIGEPWHTVFQLNPMAGVVEGFRWAFLGGVRPSVGGTLISTATAAILLVAGILYFRRVERSFADVI